jgi:hypothetical protein
MLEPRHSDPPRKSAYLWLRVFSRGMLTVQLIRSGRKIVNGPLGPGSEKMEHELMLVFMLVFMLLFWLFTGYCLMVIAQKTGHGDNGW